MVTLGYTIYAQKSGNTLVESPALHSFNQPIEYFEKLDGLDIENISLRLSLSMRSYLVKVLRIDFSEDVVILRPEEVKNHLTVLDEHKYKYEKSLYFYTLYSFFKICSENHLTITIA